MLCQAEGSSDGIRDLRGAKLLLPCFPHSTLCQRKRKSKSIARRHGWQQRLELHAQEVPHRAQKAFLRPAKSNPLSSHTDPRAPLSASCPTVSHCPTSGISFIQWNFTQHLFCIKHCFGFPSEETERLRHVTWPVQSGSQPHSKGTKGSAGSGMGWGHR